MNPSSLKDQRRAGARRIRWVAVTAGVLAVVVASVAIASQSADGPDATSSASVKKQVKKLDKKVKKLNKKLKKVDKEEGPAGQNGQNGAAGADGLGAIMGHTQANGGGTTFAPLNGGPRSFVESGAEILSPNREITLGEFSLSGDSVTVGLTATVRVNGSNTAIICSVIPGGNTCSSGASVTVAPRSKLALKMDNQDGGDIDLGWSMTAS